jgi:SPP1 family phage portal protein
MEELDKLLETDDVDKIKALFLENRIAFEVDHDEALKEYKVATHDVMDEDVRKKKQIKKDTGKLDDKGQPVMATTMVDVARVSIPFQKIIVERRVGFMLSTPVKYELTSETLSGKKGNDLVTLIEKIQSDNKMDYKNKELARRLMSECEVAELWYLNPAKNPELGSKFDLKMTILSPDLGDELFPLFDDYGDLIAFGRGYQVKRNGTYTQFFDVYTKDFEYKWMMTDNGWAKNDSVTSNPVPIAVQKIPIIYYSQLKPEWQDVQALIDRLETILSNHADMNDYYGSPILTVSGQVEGYAGKGEQGKVMQLSEGAQANYLALASEPNSVKMELDNLEKFIYAMSQTPDITFERLQGIGNLSGVALRLMFMDAHMAVKMKEEIFGIGLQRRVNLLKVFIGKIIDTMFSDIIDKATIEPIITPYIPEHTTEMIENLASSTTAGLMSTETAVGLNPLVTDPEQELKLLEGEKNTESDLQDIMNTMNQNPQNQQNPKNQQNQQNAQQQNNNIKTTQKVTT